jgi:hypothetical protein
MIITRLLSATRLFLVALALGGVALAVAATPPTDAAGLRNCVEITGPQTGRVGCWELVWVNGVQQRMVFSNQNFPGNTPQDLAPFYVTAPQTSAPQGYPPNTFPHDHTVGAAPAQNGGAYTTRYQGFFVFCSGAGIASGTCVPTWTNLGGPNPAPLATTVNGQPLTSVAAIEAAASAGLVVLDNLGPNAVIVGSISGT